MILSAKAEYAAIAVLALANHYVRGEPVRLREISDTHGIPSAFLVQILLQLKAAGLVESTRGSSGGYRLARDPSQVTLGEVKAVIEGPTGELASSISTPTETSRILLDVWKEIDAFERDKLSQITFAELSERHSGAAEKMYYI